MGKATHIVGRRTRCGSLCSRSQRSDAISQIESHLRSTKEKLLILHRILVPAAKEDGLQAVDDALLLRQRRNLDVLILLVFERQGREGVANVDILKFCWKRIYIYESACVVPCEN